MEVPRLPARLVVNNHPLRENHQSSDN